MGWQSYFLTYTCKEELENIFQVINDYQKIWFGDSKSNEEIGEEIVAICFCRVTKSKKIKDKYVLLFGIGGGRSYCESFFEKRGLELHYFEQSILKSVEQKDLWYRYNSSYQFDNKFSYFTDEFIEKLLKKNYVNIYTIDERKNAIKFIKKYKTVWNPSINELPDNDIIEIIKQITNKQETVKL